MVNKHSKWIWTTFNTKVNFYYDLKRMDCPSAVTGPNMSILSGTSTAANRLLIITHLFCALQLQKFL